MPATPTPHPGRFSAVPATREQPESTGVSPTLLSLSGFECSLATVPLDELERVAHAVTREAIRDRFAGAPETEEVALLSTCHRIELLVLTRGRAESDRWREMLPGPLEAWTAREGRELVRHVFRVAAGRESLAYGEAEVAGQVRAAVGTVRSRHPRPVLRSVLREAAATADGLAGPAGTSASIAAVAVDRLLALVDRPWPRVLVVGSGTVGRQVVRALVPHARVVLLFHERPPEAAFLEATGAPAVRMDHLREQIEGADVVVTAAKFGDGALGASDLPRDRPLLLVDLGMPRNVDPAVRALPNVRLLDLGELYARPRAVLGSVLVDRELEERAARCYDRLEPELGSPLVDLLLREAEAARRAEVESARPFLGPLEPGQEAAIERLTRRLTARFLVPATERIRSLPPGATGDAERRRAFELLRPRPPDP